jgi:hypothetical protein
VAVKRTLAGWAAAYRVCAASVSRILLESSR